ncbi:MAG: bifunctional hydroxymethylpyrimidine kinase/phosphomethylpyrimidine kinase, partial [Desulfurococcales archaeon]|nr:bifunctional hydroxymethylpyrimidine kinase/phosphomethylpyrimidine kinase [Desulfurococcales archaeon]
PAARWEVVSNLREAAEVLKSCGKCVAAVMPEVQINIGMALPKPYARSAEDVAAFPGRIGKFRDIVIIKGNPEFGASKHIASAILTAMQINPEVRAAGNIIYNEEVRKAVEALGLRWSFFDRKEEPPEIKEKEGGTTPWGVRKAAERLGGKLPEAIFDYGEHGKEPLTLIFGRTAKEVAEKIVAIGKEVSRR